MIAQHTFGQLPLHELPGGMLHFLTQKAHRCGKQLEDLELEVRFYLYWRDRDSFPDRVIFQVDGEVRLHMTYRYWQVKSPTLHRVASAITLSERQMPLR